MNPTPSLTLLTDDAHSSEFVALTKEPVEESDCSWWALLLFFGGNIQPSHETAVARLLARYHADVILHATMDDTVYGFPYVFMESCANVKGIPARRIASRVSTGGHP